MWNTLSTDCVHVSNFNTGENRIDKYLIKAGTVRIIRVDSR